LFCAGEATVLPRSEMPTLVGSHHDLAQPVGLERKVIFQGVHQLTSSDLGELWRAEEARASTLS
jgi:hypothetical protein